MTIGFLPLLVFCFCVVLMLIYGALAKPLNLSGLGATVLVVIMLIALMLIAPAYAVSDNYTKEELSGEWAYMLFLALSAVADVLVILFMCWSMCKKVEKNHDKKRKERLLTWIKCLNKHYKEEICGFDKIIALIQDNYTNENLLCLFELCGVEGLVCKFKEVTDDKKILLAVNEICKEYDIENDFSGLTIRQLFKVVKEEKSKCIGCIYNEDEIETYDYQLIKEKYYEHCK